MISSIAVPSWSPYGNYTWTKAQVRAWINANGSWCFYDGEMYLIHSKHIGAGMYSVTFKRKKI